MIRCIVIVLVVISSVAIAQTPNELPPDVRTALEQNARLIDPISVEFTQILRPLIPTSEIEETFNIDPKSQEAYFARRTTKLSLQGFCERTFESHDLPEVTASGTRWANNWESAFDGTWLQHGSPQRRDQDNELKPSLDRTHVQHLIVQQPHDRLGVRDYFRAIGLCGPSSWTEKAAKQRLQSTALKMLADQSSLISVQDETTNGQRLVRIELETRDPDVSNALVYDFDKANERLESLQTQIAASLDSASLQTEAARLKRSIATMERLRQRPELRRYIWFLDPARNHTIVRYEQRSPDGVLLLAGTNSDFFQPPDRAIWLPRRVVEDRYSDLAFSRVFAEAALRTEIELKSADTTPKDPWFFTLVYTAPGSRTRQTDADGKNTEEEIPADGAQLEKSPEPVTPTTQPSSSIGWPNVKYATAAAALVILITVLIAVARSAQNRKMKN